MGQCRYCGTKTGTSVWTKGTPRRFVPLCSAAACWRKYWDEFPSSKRKKK